MAHSIQQGEETAVREKLTEIVTKLVLTIVKNMFSAYLIQQIQ